MSNPIKLTELSGDVILLNADTIEAIKEFNGVAHIFTDSGDPSAYQVKESLEEIEALMLRDRFAMSAMGQMIISCMRYDREAENMAFDKNYVSELAYQQADAMLKARKEGV